MCVESNSIGYIWSYPFSLKEDALFKTNSIKAITSYKYEGLDCIAVAEADGFVSVWSFNPDDRTTELQVRVDKDCDNVTSLISIQTNKKKIFLIIIENNKDTEEHFIYTLIPKNDSSCTLLGKYDFFIFEPSIFYDSITNLKNACRDKKVF